LSVLAIVPARSGSKRLPEKNSLDFVGRPLIVWTIEAAIKSKIFSRIIVSTNSDKIKKISIAANAEVPFKRPKYLSQDDSSSYEVVRHSLDFFENILNIKFDYVALLQPTSPLRTSLHLQNAFDNMLEQNAHSCVSVVKSFSKPEWMFNLTENGFRMEPYISKKIRENNFKNSNFYSLNGAIYICNVSRFIKYQKFIYNDTLPYIMDKDSSIDIDTKVDFENASKVMSERLKSIIS
jgi:CMP-N,N'-diacetyllegionaminic acid synthase